MDIGIVPNVKFIKNSYKFMILKWNLDNKTITPNNEVKFVMMSKADKALKDPDGVQPKMSSLLSLSGTYRKQFLLNRNLTEYRIVYRTIVLYDYTRLR